MNSKMVHMDKGHGGPGLHVGMCTEHTLALPELLVQQLPHVGNCVI